MYLPSTISYQPSAICPFALAPLPLPIYMLSPPSHPCGVTNAGLGPAAGAFLELVFASFLIILFPRLPLESPTVRQESDGFFSRCHESPAPAVSPVSSANHVWRGRHSAHPIRLNKDNHTLTTSFLEASCPGQVDI